MKCSHGIQFEVKCTQCFDEGMARVLAAASKSVKLHDYGLRGKPETEKVFVLGGIQTGIDTNPRLL